MKKIAFFLLILNIVFGLSTEGFIGFAKAADAPTPTRPPAKAPVKIGTVIPYTGPAAMTVKDMEAGMDFALAKYNSEVSGRKVELIKEDETDDPSIAVAKARKLVEQDKVDVVIGGLLTHTSMAMEAYMKRAGKVFISLSGADAMQSDWAFTGAGNKAGSFPSGLWAYDELGARKAAVLFMDYLSGHQNRDGFIAGFTYRGGKIVSNRAVPMGTADMAPYLQTLGDVDLIAWFLVPPADMTFVRQYHEFGLKIPSLSVSCVAQEEPIMRQMADNVLGMYGASFYSPLIDTPENKDFVVKFKNKFGVYPGMATIGGFGRVDLYLNAVTSTGGDTNPDKVTKALLGMKEIDYPWGKNYINPGRITSSNLYIYKAVKLEGNRYAWKPIKTYTDYFKLYMNYLKDTGGTK